MHGFGFFSRIDELKDASKQLSNKDIIPSDNEYSEDENEELNNVTVIKLDTDEYKSTGSAGNVADEQEKVSIEPQLGGMGLGTSCGMKKEFARTEGFQGSDTTDDEPTNIAQERADSNKIDKISPETAVSEMFGEMFGKDYGINKDNIHDMSKPHVNIDTTTNNFKVKKGW